MRRVACLLLVVAGCSRAPDAPADPVDDPTRIIVPIMPGNPPANPGPVVPIVAVNATVEFLNLEGGCWALKVGEEFRQPLNLPAEFRQDGLAVRVVLQPVDNVASICMIGPIVRIVSIQRR